jgi:hypothetical protein
MADHPVLTGLETDLTTALEETKLAKLRCDKIRRDLDDAETLFIECKERVLAMKEAVEKYKTTQVLSTIDQDLKAAGIAAFSARLPGVRAIVDAQDARREERELQVELDGVKHKVLTHIANRDKL